MLRRTRAMMHRIAEHGALPCSFACGLWGDHEQSLLKGNQQKAPCLPSYTVSGGLRWCKEVSSRKEHEHILDMS